MTDKLEESMIDRMEKSTRHHKVGRIFRGFIFITALGSALSALWAISGPEPLAARDVAHLVSAVFTACLVVSVVLMCEVEIRADQKFLAIWKHIQTNSVAKDDSQ